MGFRDMFEWDLEREAQERDVFFKLVHVTAGVYLWEFLVSLSFDASLLTRRRKLTFPTVISS
ncbi:hypothetical protein QCA50_011910 [Cerrena zonata]|uniref:Uncharacterized protein n=1 Tax=Cerrena zonata TaxID=2478898 RepID=A0AAW0FTW8_9APHY